MFCEHILGLQGWFCWISDFKLSSDRFIEVEGPAWGENVIGRRKDKYCGPDMPRIDLEIWKNTNITAREGIRQVNHVAGEGGRRWIKWLRHFYSTGLEKSNSSIFFKIMYNLSILL